GVCPGTAAGATRFISSLRSVRVSWVTGTDTVLITSLAPNTSEPLVNAMSLEPADPWVVDQYTVTVLPVPGGLDSVIGKRMERAPEFPSSTEASPTETSG